MTREAVMPMIQGGAWSVAEPEIMELSGRIDSATSPRIEEDVLLCIQSGARDMILDCSNVSYITGTGMQSLLRMAREMQKARGNLAVCNLQPQVRDVFDFCGLESAIPVYESMSAARLALAA
jgi:stage II sporulation protein AA (anti-sigma F factor antagonist)